MSTLSPFANSLRQQLQPFDKSQFGIGALFKRLGAARPATNVSASTFTKPRGSALDDYFERKATTVAPQINQPTAMTYNRAMGRNMQQDVKSPEEQAMIDAAIAAGPTGPSMNTSGPAEYQSRINAALKARSQPANPFAGNEQYQALMEYQQSLAPNQEQQARLQELRSAFEGTGGYKDYRINQLQNQLQQRQRNPMMGMGLGGMRPMGMQPYQGFGRPQFPMQMPMQQPMRQFGAMGYNQPQPYQQQQSGMMGGYGMSPYQQMRPQPQQFGGYGMGQSMGGYGGYGGMSNPYQPQQMGSYNPNNFMGYLQ